MPAPTSSGDVRPQRHDRSTIIVRRPTTAATPSRSWPAGCCGGPSRMAENESYELHVNGSSQTVRDAWVGESLLFVLRERLGLLGSKVACEQGECGSCSVIVDGGLVCSCIVLA